MDIKITAVECEHEGEKFSLARDMKSFPPIDETYILHMGKEFGIVFNDPGELTISTSAWKLALKKPDPHPLYFPVMSMIRAIKGETD